MPATAEQNRQIIDLLVTAYNAEIETIMNYLANSVNLDGVRAEQIKSALAADIQEELGHAQQLAKRIKTIGGVVPGSHGLSWSQTSLQPPDDSTDVVAVIRGVIEAENDAIATYEKLVKLSADVDPVSEDLAITLMADEQDHRREFEGFLKEYERAGVA